MTIPAARLSDMCAHGGAIVMGHPTTLIGGQPAARMGDTHVCPLTTGPVPHVGGPVALGAFTVLVAGTPLARQGDVAVCVGPPDAIARGLPTVLVGSTGGGGLGGVLSSLAVVGMAAVNRIMSGGYPRSVVDDTKATITQYNRAVSIEGSLDYQAIVTKDLDQLRAALEDGDPSTGGKVLSALERSGKKSRIRPVGAGGDQANASCTPANPSDDVPGIAQLGKDDTPGTGADSVVEYNPSLVSDYRGEDGSTYQMQPHDTLAHEMIHALHQARGEDRYALPDPQDPGDNQEEARTIGVHGFEQEELSERQLHAEAGRSPRPDHNSVTRDVYRSTDDQWYESSVAPGGTRTTQAIEPPAGAFRPNH